MQMTISIVLMFVDRCWVCTWLKTKVMAVSWELQYVRLLHNHLWIMIFCHHLLIRKCFRHSLVSACTNWAWAGWLMTDFINRLTHLCPFVRVCVCARAQASVCACVCVFTSFFWTLSDINITLYEHTLSVTRLPHLTYVEHILFPCPSPTPHTHTHSHSHIHIHTSYGQ